MLRKLLCPFVLLLCASPLLAQTTPPPANPQGQNGAARRGNFTPCWQQAGIEKSVMEQRWAIERETRSQVEAVCSNSSLTPQQKHQQARELRQEGRTKMEGLVTPEQEKALTACQQQHNGGNHPAGGAMHEGGMHEEGGCGEWPHNGQRPGGSPNGTPGNGNGNGGSTAPPPNPSSPN